MYEAEKFILTTDYSTMKNDGHATTSLTIPGSINIAAGTTQTYSSTVSLGTSGGIYSAKIYLPTVSAWFPGEFFTYALVGSTPTISPAIYSVILNVFRSSSTQVTFQAFINNPYSNTLTTNASSVTLNADITSFLPPFAAI